LPRRHRRKRRGRARRRHRSGFDGMSAIFVIARRSPIAGAAQKIAASASCRLRRSGFSHRTVCVRCVISIYIGRDHHEGPALRKEEEAALRGVRLGPWRPATDCAAHRPAQKRPATLRTDGRPLARQRDAFEGVIAWCFPSARSSTTVQAPQIYRFSSSSVFFFCFFFFFFSFFFFDFFFSFSVGERDMRRLHRP